MKPYYEDSKAGIVIWHADCREILPTLPKVDLVLTDPPYGIGVSTDQADKKRGFRPYDVGCRSINHPPVFGDDKPFNPALIFRTSATSYVLWGANNYADRLPTSHCWFVWDRKTERGADSDITDCELAWTCGLKFKTVRLFRHMWAGFQRDSEVGEKVLHPTQKPVALMSWCLRFFPTAKVVLDPYLGSGPVLRAAKDLGRKAIGIEICEEYCAIAAKRLEQEVLPLSERPTAYENA